MVFIVMGGVDDTAADFGCDNIAVLYRTVKIHIFQNGHMVQVRFHAIMC